MKIFKRVLIIICIILSFCVNKSLAVSGTVKASAIRVRENQIQHQALLLMCMKMILLKY